MSALVLVVNTGSSSLKYSLVDADTGDELADGLVEQIGESSGAVTHRSGGEERRDERVVADHCAGTPYDVAFLDPPYDLAADRLEVIVTGLAEQHWLADDAVVVVERATRGPEWRWPSPFVAERSRRYGEATLWYGRAAIPPDVPSSADAGSTAGE